MKPRIALIVFASVFFRLAQAQYCGGSADSICTPGGPYANPGFYPDYNVQTCFVKNVYGEAYIDLQIPQLLNGVTVDSIRIDSIGNLPTGLCWRMGQPNNRILGGQTGCIQVSGIATGVPGQYKMHVSGTAWSSLGVFPNLNIEQFSFRYFLRMVCDSQSVCPLVDINAGAFTNVGYDQSCVPVAKLHFANSTAVVNEADGNVLVNYVKVQSLTNGSQSVDVVRKTGDAADVSGFNVQTLVFNTGGPDSLPFYLNINNDALIEGDEVLQFVLRNATGSGQILADSTFDLTIVDDDTVSSTTPELAFGTDTLRLSEHDTTFQLAINIFNQENDTVKVSIGTGIGNALPTVDFSFSPALITFPPNSSIPQLLTITIHDDQFVEGTEFATFILYNPTNGAILGNPSACVLVIDDNDVVSAHQPSAEVLYVVPNPVRNKLRVVGALQSEQVQVYNMLGERLLSEAIAEDGELRVADLPSGIYTLSIRNRQIRWLKE